MSKPRKRFSVEFKTRVALDALSGEHTLMELASKYGVHPNQVSQWKKPAKRHLRKYNGIPREHFGLYLKKCEFRFNYGSPKEQRYALKKIDKETQHGMVIYVSPENSIKGKA